MIARALLVDAAQTLLQPREPVALTYARLGAPYGVTRDLSAIEAGFRQAFRQPWAGLRYEGSGRPFWRAVVEQAAGSADPDYFEALYQHFGRADAWDLAEGALPCFAALRSAGWRVAVVSNWDDRLRPLLADLGVLSAIDEALISGEIGLEKPDPAIFLRACSTLRVEPADALHVGDHPEHDVAAARAAGCQAWLWGRDVASFVEVQTRLLR